MIWLEKLERLRESDPERFKVEYVNAAPRLIALAKLARDAQDLVKHLDGILAARKDDPDDVIKGWLRRYDEATKE
jgi:hypothetical protein